MFTVDIGKSKLLNNSIVGFDLLSNRIQERNLKFSAGSKRNTRKSSASTHIQNFSFPGGKVRKKSERIKNMKYQSLVDIYDTRKVDVLIDLDNIQKVLQADLELLFGNIQSKVSR